MEDNRAVVDKRSNPFVMVTRAVVEDESLKAADKSVYTALCMFADNRTLTCYPSRKTIMKLAGVSDNTLRNSMAKLVEKGYILIEERFKSDGGQLSNMYTLLDV